MCAGVKLISRPASIRVSRSVASRAPLVMYHCLVEMISSGRSPFSKNFTWCMIGFGSPISSPLSRSSSTIRCLRAEHGLAGELRVGGSARRRVCDRLGRLGDDAAVWRR